MTRVLAFHRAVGFVHASIPDAVDALVAGGVERGLHVEPTDDPARFTDDGLAPFDVVVFVHTSGNVLSEPAQRRALEGHLARGGGFVGIHAASAMAPDVRDDWPWFRELVGAAFIGHTVARLYRDEPMDDAPGFRYAGPLADAPSDAEHLAGDMAWSSCEPATVHVEDADCPASRGLVDGSTVVEEWYGFDENPRAAARIVATVDESTYEPYRGAMGADHPIIWWRPFGGGRSVYDARGHAAATWRDPSFLDGIFGAIELAASSDDAEEAPVDASEVEWVPVTFERYDHVEGPFFHGTKSRVEVGELLEAGFGSNFQDGRRSNNIYFAALVETAVWGAELATALAGSNERGHVYVVEPLGPFEDDPNVTNKRFPGNVTQSYRSRHPLRVVGEVEEWEGHPPEVLQGMLDNIERLRAQGLDVIED